MGIKINNLIAEFLKEKSKLLRLTQPELAEKRGRGLRFLRESENEKES